MALNDGLQTFSSKMEQDNFDAGLIQFADKLNCVAFAGMEAPIGRGNLENILVFKSWSLVKKINLSSCRKLGRADRGYT